MATGGIETEEARKGVDLEQAILGNAPVNTTTTGGSPGVPASQTPVAPGTPASNAPGSGFVPPNPTNFGWPGVGMGGQGSAYGWPVGDEAMGQRNVASIATPTGPVPVAQQGMPFGAIASRQQAIAERKAAAAKAKQDLYAKFDPQAEIGAPAAPYTVAFNQYVQKDWARFTDDWTKAHGGDRAAAMRYLVENPEGQAYVKQWARDKSAVAKENVHYFEKATDLLTKVASGEATAMDKESIDAAMKFVRALDEKGMPLKGVTDIEMRALGRNFEKVISTQQYIKTIAQPAANLVQSQAQKLGETISLGHGRYAIEDMSVKDFSGFIDEYADGLVAATLGTMSKEQAVREMEKVFNNEIRRTLKDFAREQPNAAQIRAQQEQLSPTINVRSSMAGDTVSIIPTRVSGQIPKITVDGTGNETVELTSPALTYDIAAERWYITGRSVTEKDIRTAREALIKDKAEKETDEDGNVLLFNDEGKIVKDQYDKEGKLIKKAVGKPRYTTPEISETEVSRYITENREGTRRSVPAEDGKNAAALEKGWGSRDANEIAAKQLRDFGVKMTPLEVKEAMKDPTRRDAILRTIGGQPPASAAPKPGSTVRGPGHKGRTSTKDPLGLF